jgi:hypothetical protein
MQAITGLSSTDSHRAELGEIHRCLTDLRRRFSQIREAQLCAGRVEAEELARFARTKDAPPGLRSLQQRIDRGDLNWEQVVLGDGGGADASALRAQLDRALARLPSTLRRALDESPEQRS